MQYVGSKNRLSKELAPIIQNYITDETLAYIEPFVGGANMIDKIKHHNKIGSDLHKELIALLNYTRDNSSLIPSIISEEEYHKVKQNPNNYDPNEYKNCVFYLDPPYRATLSYKTGKFPYEEFDKWAIELAKNNVVLISEYQMPEDKFECIWSKDVKVGISGQGDIKNKKRVENLFKVR